MNLIITILALFLCSCQVNNSNSGDDSKFSEGVASVFQNRCAQCHQYASLGDQDFVAQGLVDPGSPETSLLFKRLRGSGVGGSEDMPPVSSGAITAAEVQVVKMWIESL